MKVYRRPKGQVVQDFDEMRKANSGHVFIPFRTFTTINFISSSEKGRHKLHNLLKNPFVLKNHTSSHKTREQVECKKKITLQNRLLLFSMMYIDSTSSNYYPVKLNRTRTFSSLKLKWKKKSKGSL